MGAKHGAVFAIQVQGFLTTGAIAVQTFWRPLLNPGAECGSKALAQGSRYKAWAEPLLSHRAEVCWRADAGIRVQLAR